MMAFCRQKNMPLPCHQVAVLIPVESLIDIVSRVFQVCFIGLRVGRIRHRLLRRL